MEVGLVMRVVLDDDVQGLVRFCHVPASNTSVGRIVLENPKK